MIDNLNPQPIDIRRRIPVLQAALMVEFFSTFLLASLLGIKDFRKAKTFSGSTALSFNAKIIMLVDIEAIGSENRKVFQKFMEIRNVFMHDLAAMTYKDCVDRIDGAETFLLTRYTPDSDKLLENQLSDAIKNLCSEVITLLKPAFTKLEEKLQAETTNQMNEELIRIYFEKMREYALEEKNLNKG